MCFIARLFGKQGFEGMDIEMILDHIFTRLSLGHIGVFSRSVSD